MQSAGTQHDLSTAVDRADILVVIAHPDDEIFVSGTICLCVEKGFAVTLVCATDGSGGGRDLLHDRPDLELGQIRRRELMLSASVLGVNAVLFLGLADVSSADAIDSSWDQPHVIRTLEEVIQRANPELILTHGPLGGYGHPAHRAVHRYVVTAAREVSFPGSIFSFCADTRNAFFSWHFDQPSNVQVNARGFLRRRAASLSYHQSQIDYFLQPYFPRTPRKYLSTLFGFAFARTETGRKRIPIGTPNRFFRRFPVEGLALQKAPDAGRAHFFGEHFAHDDRVQIAD